ncbi:hypothetical protein [Terrisporobacter vanillatitrophus]|uniref:hypothetical protein n=1 Tax=Terrisporobacter vanillatitrophus TaxID=3058402 RepID=UPI003EBCB59E
MFLLYIVAVPLIISIKNIKSTKSLYFILLILMLQNIIVFINNSKNYELNLYTSTFFRIFDFIIGMLLAKKFMGVINVKKTIKNIMYMNL